MSLARMSSYFGMVKLADDVVYQRLVLLHVKGAMLPQIRDNLVRMAKENEADYLLFVDTDMTFPRDTIHRLLRWDKDFVACNCPIKRYPSGPTARLADGNWLFTGPLDEGLIEVNQVGLGVALIKPSVFDRIERPWFEMSWVPEARIYMGEDVHLMRKMKAANIPLYVDQGVSGEIEHVGSWRYTHAMTEPQETRAHLSQGEGDSEANLVERTNDPRSAA